MQDSGGRAWREEQGGPWAFPVWAGTRKAALKEQRRGRVTPSQRPGRRGRRDALTLCEYVQSVSHKHV